MKKIIFSGILAITLLLPPLTFGDGHLSPAPQAVALSVPGVC